MCVTICWFFLQDDRLKLPNVTSIDEVSEKRTVDLLPLHWEWVSIYVTLTPYIMVPRILTTTFRRVEEGEDLVVMHILLCIGSLLTVLSEKTW